MRHYIRAHTPGATYFFTLTLADRSASWLVDHIDALRSAFRDVKRRHPFQLDAVVVLPDHLHALWTLPEDDADFGTRWMLIKQGFTKRLHAQGVLDPRSASVRGIHGELGLCQRRFWEHQVHDEADFAAHVEYIHFNPVKHGHVTRAADWPHSSFHRDVKQGVLRSDWGLAAPPQEGRFGE